MEGMCLYSILFVSFFYYVDNIAFVLREKFYFKDTKKFSIM